MSEKDKKPYLFISDEDFKKVVNYYGLGVALSYMWKINQMMNTSPYIAKMYLKEMIEKTKTVE